MQLLLQFFPSFLQLSELWVELLLRAELNVRDECGRNALSYLLRNELPEGFDFECAHFRRLFES